jgi:hypothetical protein
MGQALDRASDVLALQAHVARAGCALACVYSSSAEFEAAVIRARRAAGAYRPLRYRRYLVCAGACAGMLILALLMTVI